MRGPAQRFGKFKSRSGGGGPTSNGDGGPLEKGVLDPDKHSVVSFKDSSSSGRGDKFKNSGNSRTSLSDSMNSMVDLINLQFDTVGDLDAPKRNGKSFQESAPSVALTDRNEKCFGKVYYYSTRRVSLVSFGNFNVILFDSEKKGRRVRGVRCSLFEGFMDAAALHDLGFRGPSFTWHKGGIFEGLYKAIGNEAWLKDFPNMVVTHLPTLKSDHKLLLLLMRVELRISKDHPLRFLARWLDHPKFLGKEVSNDEIKEALFDMVPLKASMSDSFQTDVYFSKGVSDALGLQLSETLRFQRLYNLGTYLGVPLLHERISRSTLHFVVDKIRNRLNRWDDKKLSIADRATLAQSVLLSVSNYFMQSMMIPKCLCDEIEYIVRQFI
ncbi:hypothetical protein J1N35_000727 [Gossypium stocksii]|uniref:Uncharacterized protein n=1 Tax=Gossypium stocksii TaxID=47602 RepID=A0A9D4ALB0_9ROSI|nr:hypothetical protein J1N35_000727 [Gossypium stocksii]